MSEKEKTGFTGKIAIATNDQKRVTSHIGKCKAFMIYEIDGEKVINKEFRENVFTNHRMMKQSHQHRGEGERRHGHTNLINGLKDCRYIIARGGGWRVVEDLKRHNIQSVFADVELIEDAINRFLKGELKNNAVLVCDHSEN